MRVAVVGHVEWVEFLRVERVPAPGEVLEAEKVLEQPAGAGAIAALQLVKLCGGATFLTALATDHLGERAYQELVAQGVDVKAVRRQGVQRRVFALLDSTAERTLVVFGEKMAPRGGDPLPWNDLSKADAVCFFSGDEAALQAARRARVLVATARWLPTLRSAGIRLDALVGSTKDPAEVYRRGDLDPEPALVVTTSGAAGGSYSVAGGPVVDYAPAPPPGPAADAYGCGDSFAAGLAYALGRGQAPDGAVAYAARCGAACLTGLGLTGQYRDRT